MTISSASRLRRAYVAEVTAGTTPATPTFQQFRATSGNLQTKKTTVVSDEIQADRNVRAEYMVGQDVTGSYAFELSYGTFDDMLAAGLMGAWASNVLTNGVLTPSLTFEETEVDLGTFSRFSGCMINTLQLAIASRKGVTGSFDIMGLVETLDTAIVTGATYVAPTTSQIITSVSVASLTVPGVTVPHVKTLSLSVANNLRIRDTVGTLYSQPFGVGQADVTGTFDAYFESNALYQEVLAHGGGALSSTLGMSTGQKYTINLPNVTFLDGKRTAGGKNDDVMVSIPFRAVYDPTTAASIQITRAVT